MTQIQAVFRLLHRVASSSQVELDLSLLDHTNLRPNCTPKRRGGQAAPHSHSLLLLPYQRGGAGGLAVVCPWGVIYTDTAGWSRPDRALLSPQFLLVGTPDYLVTDGGDVNPVEV